MSNLQVKNVPEELHRRLRQIAEREGTSVRSLVLEAVARRVAWDDFVQRLRTRAPVDLGRPAGTTLEEVRDERDAEPLG
jgi:antitoxin FitA